MNGRPWVCIHQTGTPLWSKKATQRAEYPPSGVTRYHWACVGPVRLALHAGKPGGRQRTWYFATCVEVRSRTRSDPPEPGWTLAVNEPCRSAPPSTLADAPAGLAIDSFRRPREPQRLT